MRAILFALAVSATLLSVIAYDEVPEENHVLLISVDGLHASDLEQWTDQHPDCHLAALQRQGITYTNAFVEGITDSFPGVLALTTGGNIAAHSVMYDVSYDHALWPPGTKCSHDVPIGPSGTTVEYTEEIDKDSTRLDGGGHSAVDAIDATKLPVNKHCQPVYPHAYMCSNTIFEVVRESGGFTAWADKHPAYDLLNGPSGKGVCDLYTPEIDSYYPGTEKGWNQNMTTIKQYDALHVKAAIHWIRGLNHDGTERAPVPTLYGFNFQSVNVAQKVPGGGYEFNGTFKGGMVEALEFVDESIGKLVKELETHDLYHCTTVIVTAKHGQAPIQPAQRRAIPKKRLEDVLSAAGIEVAQMTTDDVALIWLKDSEQTKDAVAAFEKAGFGELGIFELIYGKKLVKECLVVAVDDERAPDIVIKVVQGVIYTSKDKGAEHGGLNPDDQHVALLVTGGGMPRASGCMGTQLHDKVTTKQVAPTILQLLDIDVNELEAVAEQHTHVLPWLFSNDVCRDEEHGYGYGYQA